MIYLASPYSHDDPAVREDRYMAVRQIALRLFEQGHKVYSPIVYTHPWAELADLPGDWEFWREMDEAMIDACAELWVAALDGWRESVGVSAEIAYARSKRKPVRYVVNPETMEVTA